MTSTEDRTALTGPDSAKENVGTWLQRINSLDRRWIYLAMAFAVGLPILLGIGSDETPSPSTKSLFDRIESLPNGSRVMMAIDYDPNSAAELTPMALAVTRHSCLKSHKIYFVTLWGTALPMIDEMTKKVVDLEFGTSNTNTTAKQPNDATKPYVYGIDYVNLGYLPGESVAINQLCTDIRKARSQDIFGQSLDSLDVMKGVNSAKEMDLIANISGGFPGAKEWVQYAATPHKIPLGAGCTGVQSTQMFPYFPGQLVGLVTGIRGANEYESMLGAKYPRFATMDKRPASRRGGPQRWAHRLMIALIVLGNVIHFMNQSSRGTSAPQPVAARVSGTRLSSREIRIWTILFVGGAAFLGYRTLATKEGVGMQYVKPVEIVGVRAPGQTEFLPLEGAPSDNTGPTKGEVRRVVRYDAAKPREDRVVWSPSRTIGLWIAALLTFCSLSYLYRDNVGYKLAEAVIVGVSAGYWMVLSFWEVMVAKVLVKVAPDLARSTVLPDTPLDTQADYWYLVPVVLGCLVFCRWLPRGAWLARWPLAFVVGTTAGLKLILFLDADFLKQISNTILPLLVFVPDQTSVWTSIDWKQSLENTVLVVSVIASLTYFYFSVEQKGWVGRVARVGVWVLMVTFGASFALTVMGRITLLTMRLQFLFDDWLGIVRMSQ